MMNHDNKTMSKNKLMDDILRNSMKGIIMNEERKREKEIVSTYLENRGLVAVDKAFVYREGLEDKVIIEKQTIPWFVDEKIKEYKEREHPTYLSSFLHIADNLFSTESNWRDWAIEQFGLDFNRKIEEVIAKAWLFGYKTDKAPSYRARLNIIEDEAIGAYLRTQSSSPESRMKTLEIGSKYIHEDYLYLSEFTEKELKDINVWGNDQWSIEKVKDEDYE